MHILLTGATGLVGTALVKRLAHMGHTVSILSRNAKRAQESLGVPLTAHDWNPESNAAPARAFLEGLRVDAVVHLAGESVAAGRWTVARKRAILESRQLGTRNLVQTLLGLPPERRPSVLVSASAVGIYGLSPHGEVTEESLPADDFLAQVCQVWESEARKAESAGLRTVQGRIGVVLSSEGGALAQMLPIFRAGAGGPQGSGRQWMSWIHIEDLVSAIVHAIETESLSGAVNWVSPHPVTNREFARALGLALRRPAFLRTPGIVLKAVFGEMAGAILGGQKVSAQKLLSSGFEFKFADLSAALATATRPAREPRSNAHREHPDV